MQVHAGVGYIEEYGIVKVYRDGRLLFIKEGTSLIQVVAAIEIGSVFEDYVRHALENFTLLAHQ